MKRDLLTLALVMLVLLFSAGYGQEKNAKSISIAVLDQDRMYDENRGISSLLAAHRVVRGMDTEFAMSVGPKLMKQIGETETELVRLRCNQQPAAATEQRLRALKKELEEKRNAEAQAKNVFFKALVDPILVEIKGKLVEFARRNGIDVIALADGSSHHTLPVIVVGPEPRDITDEFIKYFNDALIKARPKD